MMAEIKVLHVIARLNIGGTAGYLLQLASELPQHGVDVTIAAGFVQGNEVEEPSVSEFKVLRIPALGRALRPLQDFLAMKQLNEIIKKEKPDIIHTHTFKAGFITRLKSRDIPVVHTFHGHLLEDPEFSGYKAKVITFIERRLARNATKLITVGRKVGSDLLDKKVGKLNQYLSIPPGVKPLVIPRKLEALNNLDISSENVFRVGWIARVTGVKNPQKVLEVAKLLPQIEFLIAGGGDLLGKIRISAPSNVCVLGWTEAEDLLGAVDVVLSTSLNEGIPVALIEAQMAGKPVIATNVGAVSEVIEDGVTGYLTQQDSRKIAELIEGLVNDGEKLSAMAHAAKSRAQKEFSINSMVEAHVALYRGLLN
jgi:glycosyltransferase involved in cell wall biosynthesis